MEKHYQTTKFRQAVRHYNNQLMKHQDDILDEMLDKERLTICAPTGTGKSRIIYSDILDKIAHPKPEIFAIATHRLLLNTQHLDEIFNTEPFKAAIGGIGYIFVGSAGINETAFHSPETTQSLSELGLNYHDILTTVSNNKELKHEIVRHMTAQRDVIIITTYNSLGKLRGMRINSFYADESHMLATTNEQGEFKENFKQITSDNNFFFTATPKDQKEDLSEGDTFLMDNEEIFGERTGLSYKVALERSLIAKPLIHLVSPVGIKADKDNYVSLENQLLIIRSAFKEHRKTVKDNSKFPEKIAPKILIKASNVSDIWEIYEALKDEFLVFGSDAGHQTSSKILPELSDHEGNYKNKESFLKGLKSLSDNEEAIIIHYDTLSEGIDVPGITGVLFLSAVLPGQSKILQTIGRATRLHSFDRERLFSNKLLPQDFTNFVKPYCSVILPILNYATGYSTEHIAQMVIDLRDNYGFKVATTHELGNDISSRKGKELEEGINELDSVKHSVSLIKEIENLVETIDTSNEKEKLRLKFRETYAKEDKTEFYALYKEHHLILDDLIFTETVN